jgi:uncharacterized protein YkwD
MSAPRSAVRFVVLLLVTGALLSGPMANPSAASASGSYESDTMKYAYSERTRRHLSPVKSSRCLDEYAERQARAMAAKNKLYHQDLGPILARCQLRLVGENVAFGYSSGKTVTSAWMNSPGHRDNLLNKDHRLLGVGAYRDSRGHWYVAQVLGAR